MKPRLKQSLSFLFVLILIFSFLPNLSGQIKGNKIVVREARELPAFLNIDAGGAFDVYLSQGDVQRVEIETDENLLSHVTAEVKGETLYLTAKAIKKYTELNAYITVPDLEKLMVHGASDLETENKIKLKELTIQASGASDAKLELDVEKLFTDASGASTIILSGKATEHYLNASGASDIKAYDLETERTVVDLSGASTAKVSANEEVTGDVSGSSDLFYRQEPGRKEVYKESSVTSGEGDHYKDTVSVRVAGVDVEVIEHNDSVKVRVGQREISVDEDGNVKYKRTYKRKFNGHWAGFDLGFNGYVTPNFDMKFNPEDEYLDLRMEKSVIVNINFFEQNIAISKDKRFGAVTGLGFSLPNYRFRRATHLSSDSTVLIGYIAEGVSVRKTKLSMMYLTVPVLFEWQTNSYCKKNSFHVGFGMVLSARLVSWTKIYYNEQNKDFQLNRYNPETGLYEPELMATSPDYPKVKQKDDWFLQPFKAEATLRIGWGWINLWMTYSVNQMFRDGRGPEVYPWSAGITLLNF
jgi:hypothetical protein